MLKLRAVIVFAVVLAGLQVRSASATTVYDNFGPGNTYNEFQYWTVAGSSYSKAAMPFELSVSGHYSFVEADLAVSLISGANSITVALADDNSGAPGATVEYLKLGPPGSSPFNASLLADPVTPTILDSGVRYWLVVSATGDTQAHWYYNTTGYSGGSQELLGTQVWIPGAYPTGAFSITGTKITAVAEPASITLFSTGILAVIGFHVARKRQSAKRSA